MSCVFAAWPRLPGPRSAAHGLPATQSERVSFAYKIQCGGSQVGDSQRSLGLMTPVRRGVAKRRVRAEPALPFVSVLVRRVRGGALAGHAERRDADEYNDDP